MNKTIEESIFFVKKLKEEVKNIHNKEIIVVAPFTSLYPISMSLKNSSIKLAAQNVHWEEKGAFTGEISPLMLKDVGCQYVIIGHSERRQHFKETDEMINKKLKSAIKHDLIPILCVGETLKEREDGLTFKVLERQIKEGLNEIESIENIIIAYEPVWAIGTGKTATPEQAEESHAFIRSLISKISSAEVSGKIKILYGGSITPENFPEIIRQENVDGGLVGGASLNIDSFLKIVNYEDSIRM